MPAIITPHGGRNDSSTKLNTTARSQAQPDARYQTSAVAASKSRRDKQPRNQNEEARSENLPQGIPEISQPAPTSAWSDSSPVANQIAVAQKSPVNAFMGAIFSASSTAGSLLAAPHISDVKKSASTKIAKIFHQNTLAAEKSPRFISPKRPEVALPELAVDRQEAKVLNISPMASTKTIAAKSLPFEEAPQGFKSSITNSPPKALSTRVNPPAPIKIPNGRIHAPPIVVERDTDLADLENRISISIRAPRKSTRRSRSKSRERKAMRISKPTIPPLLPVAPAVPTVPAIRDHDSASTEDTNEELRFSLGFLLAPERMSMMTIRTGRADSATLPELSPFPTSDSFIPPVPALPASLRLGYDSPTSDATKFSRPSSIQSKPLMVAPNLNSTLPRASSPLMSAFTQFTANSRPYGTAAAGEKGKHISGITEADYSPAFTSASPLSMDSPERRRPEPIIGGSIPAFKSPPTASSNHSLATRVLNNQAAKHAPSHSTTLVETPSPNSSTYSVPTPDLYPSKQSRSRHHADSSSSFTPEGVDRHRDSDMFEMLDPPVAINSNTPPRLYSPKRGDFTAPITAPLTLGGATTPPDPSLGQFLDIISFVGSENLSALSGPFAWEMTKTETSEKVNKGKGKERELPKQDNEEPLSSVFQKPAPITVESAAKSAPAIKNTPFTSLDRLKQNTNVITPLRAHRMVRRASVPSPVMIPSPRHHERRPSAPTPSTGGLSTIVFTPSSHQSLQAALSSYSPSVHGTLSRADSSPGRLRRIRDSKREGHLTLNMENIRKAVPRQVPQTPFSNGSDAFSLTTAMLSSQLQGVKTGNVSKITPLTASNINILNSSNPPQNLLTSNPMTSNLVTGVPMTGALNTSLTTSNPIKLATRARNRPPSGPRQLLMGPRQPKGRAKTRPKAGSISTVVTDRSDITEKTEVTERSKLSSERSSGTDRASSTAVPSRVPSQTPSRTQSLAYSSTPITPGFDTQLVRFKGLTLDVAKWTFSQEELHEVTMRAISLASDPLSIRLLPGALLDKDIPEEIERLELKREEIKADYKYQFRRRTNALNMLSSLATFNVDISRTSKDGSRDSLRSPSHTLAKISNITEELRDIGNRCDQLAEELHLVCDQIAQLHQLVDAHSASALSMALRKINTGFLKANADVEDLQAQLENVAAEREEAWSMAASLEKELDEIKANSNDRHENSNGNANRDIHKQDDITTPTSAVSDITRSGIPTAFAAVTSPSVAETVEEIQSTPIESIASPEPEAGQTVDVVTPVSGTSRVTLARKGSARRTAASLRSRSSVSSSQFSAALSARFSKGSILHLSYYNYGGQPTRDSEIPPVPALRSGMNSAEIYGLYSARKSIMSSKGARDSETFGIGRRPESFAGLPSTVSSASLSASSSTSRALLDAQNEVFQLLGLPVKDSPTSPYLRRTRSFSGTDFAGFRDSLATTSQFSPPLSGAGKDDTIKGASRLKLLKAVDALNVTNGPKTANSISMANEMAESSSQFATRATEVGPATAVLSATHFTPLTHGTPSTGALRPDSRITSFYGAYLSRSSSVSGVGDLKLKRQTAALNRRSYMSQGSRASQSDLDAIYNGILDDPEILFNKPAKSGL